MNLIARTLTVRTSPHIKAEVQTNEIMLNVVFALIPVVLFCCYAFGLPALLLLTVTTVTCVCCEHILCKLAGKESSVTDWSAVITGLLLGLCLPPNLPLWMACLGGIVSIALGKFIFGGLGCNVFNPALVGRAFLQAAFPVALTTWHPAFAIDRFSNLLSSTITPPLMKPEYDAISGATPLGAMKFSLQITPFSDLVVGNIPGSAGETCGLLILLGGLYLACRKMINWRIPIAIFLSIIVISGISHLSNPDQYPPPLFSLFSGGLMLGAVFMATDMVASPLSPKGVWIYGIIIGVVTMVIRLWGGLPEGVMYSILFANALSPLIERFTQPRVYGTRQSNRL